MSGKCHAPATLYPGKNTSTHWIGRLGGPQQHQSGCFGEEKNLLPLLTKCFHDFHLPCEEYLVHEDFFSHSPPFIIFIEFLKSM
jgi:hypothetical protein